MDNKNEFSREHLVSKLREAVDIWKDKPTQSSKQRVDEITTLLKAMETTEVTQAPPSVEKPITPSVGRESKSFSDILSEGVTDVGSALSVDTEDPLSSRVKLRGARALSEAIETGAEFAGEGIARAWSASLPVREKISGFIEETIPEGYRKAVTGQINDLLKTTGVQNAVYMASTGIDNYKEWAKNNPNTARDLESLINIGVVASPATPKQVPIKLPLEGLKDARTETAANYLTSMRLVGREYFESDDQWGKVRDVGSLKSFQVVPNDRALRAAEELGKLETIVERKPRTKFKPNKNYTYNKEVVENNIAMEANRLTNVLRGRFGNIEYDEDQLASQLGSILTKIDEGKPPFVFAEGLEKKASNAIKLVSQVLSDKDTKYVADLMDSRKEFDSIINDELGDATLESQKAASKLLREVRRAMNEEVFRATGSNEAKESLAKQTRLYDALDLVSAHASQEQITLLGKILDSFDLRATTTPLAAAATVGAGVGAATSLRNNPSLGYAALGALAGAGSVLAAHKTLKAMTPNQARETIGEMIKFTNEKIKEAGGDDLLLKQLRSDRLLLVDMFQNTIEQNQTDGPTQPLRQPLTEQQMMGVL